MMERGARERELWSIKSQIMTDLGLILGDIEQRELDARGVKTSEDLRAKKITVTRYASDSTGFNGYIMTLQGLNDPGRTTASFSIDDQSLDRDGFVGTHLSSGDYNRLLEITSQLRGQVRLDPGAGA